MKTGFNLIPFQLHLSNIIFTLRDSDEQNKIEFPMSSIWSKIIPPQIQTIKYKKAYFLVI